MVQNFGFYKQKSALTTHLPQFLASLLCEHPCASIRMYACKHARTSFFPTARERKREKWRDREERKRRVTSWHFSFLFYFRVSLQSRFFNSESYDFGVA